MAVKTIDEIRSGLSDQERALLDNLFAKEPELKNGWLRQDDYSRKQQALQTRETELADVVAYKAKMEPWAAEAYERIKGLEEAGVIDPETGKELWTEQKAEYERKIAEARVAGGDMTPEELDSKVREIVRNAGGALSKEEIAALYADQAKTAVEAGFKAREEKFNQETIPFVAGFSSAVAVVASRYERETGEKWTPEKQQELFGLMSAEKKFDAFAVEDKLMEPIRLKKSREKEIQDEVNRRLSEMGMPGGGGERYIPQPGQPKGALQMALEGSGGSDNLENLIKSQAVSAATELIAEGKR